MPSNLSKLMVGAALVGQMAITMSNMAAFADDTKSSTRPHIDLAFCIDTTGSMDGEIENVKAKTKEIVAKLAGGKPAPMIRVGLVAFRDRGDEYVTKVFPFSDDIDKVVKDISSLKADGGGDTPEAVTEGLHASLNDLKWTDDKKTLKLLFLIGDAEPNSSKLSWEAEAKSAISHGIQINTLGCQGIEMGSGSNVFQQIAKLADGRYESLAYRQEIVNAAGKKETYISSGGSTYRVHAKSADKWKAGVAALSAHGEAERMTAMPVRAAGGGAMGMTASSARVMGRMSRAKSASFADEERGVSMSRLDNNLADVVLQATKDAAAKKLNLDFSAK